MKRLKKISALLPGILLALSIAAAARFLEALLPIHLIGASVIALFIGMLIHTIRKPGVRFEKGLRFTSKKILKFAIILLGASLHIGIVMKVGRLSLVVMCFTLLTCFGGGYLVGRALKIDWKLSSLISAGTGICGGSAIAAIAPVIEADDGGIAYAMSATFLFDMAMILLFPIMGHALGLSDIAYGLWAGTAVNDTSSVVAAGYAFSEKAGDFATMVKLTRTLSIIPTVIIFALIQARLRRKEADFAGSSLPADRSMNLRRIIPWFILGFLALTTGKSLGLIPAQISSTLKALSRFLMVSALAAIGLNTSLQEMRRSGIAPMLHGFIISALVVIVAIGVEFFMGLV